MLERSWRPWYRSGLAAGFTLVELITVILLLGILSAFAIARSGSVSDFEPRRFATNAAQQYRFARGLASGRYDDPTSFAITLAADTFSFTTRSSFDGVVRQESLSTKGLIVTASTGASSDTIGTSGGLEIDFSSTGEILTASVGGTALQTELGVEIEITGDTTQTLCIYPTGYLSGGLCE